MSDTVTTASPDAQVEEQRRHAEQVADRAASRAAVLDRLGIVAPFIVVVALGTALAPSFLSGANLRSIAVNAAIVAIVGFGMTVVIAAGGLDLSVGSVAALSTVVAADSINAFGPLVGVLAALVVGGAAGLVNGLLVAVGRIPAFVATLAMMSVARGAALLFADGQRIQVGSDSFRSIATDRVLGVPLPFWIAVAVGLVLHVVLERTATGRHVCAVGGNATAAEEAGLRRRPLLIGVFVLSGLAAGVSGVLVTAQLGTVDATPIIGLELQAIAIAVLGGTSLRGGAGNVPGTLVGALVLGMISAGLNLLNVPGYYQYLALGLVLLLALSLDAVRIRLRRRGRTSTVVVS